MNKNELIPVTFPNAPFGKYGLTPQEAEIHHQSKGFPKEFSYVVDEFGCEYK